MTQKELTDRITYLVKEYIANADSFDANPQLRIEPADMLVTIENGADMLNEMADNQEFLEEGAAVEGIASEENENAQIRRIPDYYAVSQLIVKGKDVPDENAISAVAKLYFD